MFGMPSNNNQSSVKYDTQKGSDRLCLRTQHVIIISPFTDARLPLGVHVREETADLTASTSTSVAAAKPAVGTGVRLEFAEIPTINRAFAHLWCASNGSMSVRWR